MLKLGKYIKPYVGAIIVAIVLLFIQAMCDLALPDYMSNIVNNGIQQGGIANAVPNAVRKSEMDKLTIFMTQKNKDKVMKDYKLIDKDSSDYNDYLKKYPKLKNTQIYVIKDIDKEENDRLNKIFGKAFLSVSGVEKVKTKAKNGFITINGSKVPANTDLFALLKKMPQEQLDKVTQGMNKKFTSLGEKMVTQAATQAVKSEYKALGMKTNKIQSDYIIRVGALMLLVSLLGGICTIAVGYLASKVSAGVSRDLRQATFRKVESFSNAEFDKFSTASLITRTTNDITQVQMVIFMIIRLVCYAPIMAVGGILRAVNKSSSMSWIIALAVVVLLSLIASIFAVAIPKFKLIQKLVDRLNLVTRENLSGMMVIRAFNTQRFEEKRFDKANKDLTDTNLFVNRIMVSLFPVMMLIMNGITLLIVWVGAHQIADAKMQVGDMMAFMQYAMQILFSFLMLSMIFIMLPRASVSGQRIAEVLAIKEEIIDPKDPKHFNGSLEGTVEFDNVCFRYHGAEDDVIKNVSFKALPGQTTAIIGSTGSGKTTLINLIPRFYDVTSGTIKIDGVDIREVTQHELRDKVGYIPQKASLFSGTIESNLKYANEDATEEDLERAADIAQASEFINGKEEGYKTEISQGGSNVSGGQKQRLSIARAIVKKAPIYIFDDSFSALDFKTDAALRRALKTKLTDSTVIIVAQRISTIINAEQIIVLDDGKVVGIGTHKELMEKCPTYQEIALSQLSKEELA
ncbi:ABC transporter ATP-binding protein [Clostridium oryzae]|uniref:Putative ABC transporter ATP-binding protein n=1 Tax=Clostridium oryzae TaxID=1450648 RepID=A0A1V4ITD9_9CLOT|nr:ABC transporter ATP-binding protein [Clostridium oryzae]OPJ63080.1 putative ABC transporter ATP-binding protein [Clostridium oryzae]